MESTRDAALDLWDSIKRDASNLLENVGVDPGVIVPIVVTVLIGMTIWWVLSNLFG